MSKLLKIIDNSTGEIVCSQEINGEYQIQFTQKTDSGRICRIGRIENGKFDDKNWIKNYYYLPIANKLVDKFMEIKHVKPIRILFLENMQWAPPNGGTKKTWIARISKANAWLQSTWGYAYVMEIKNYFVETMSREQIVALIYHELRHIDEDGELKSHDIEDWDNMVSTLGTDWAQTKSEIINLLDDEFPGWNELRKHNNQISMFDDEIENTFVYNKLLIASKTTEVR